MPAMGEAVRQLLAARATEISSGSPMRRRSPAGQQITADLRRVRDAIDTLVTDVRAALDAAFEQAGMQS